MPFKTYYVNKRVAKGEGGVAKSKGVLLLGGSGFIGSRITRRLLEDGEVDFIRIVDLLPPKVENEKIQFLSHNLRDQMPLEYGDGVGVIYNLAAVHSTPGHPDHEYYDNNISEAINCTEFAERCHIDTILFTSSISTYGPSEEVRTEESPTTPESAYGRSKLLCEMIHQQWQARAKGRRLVIVRPGVIFGPGEGGNYTSLAAALRTGYFFYPGRRDTVKSGAYVDELVNAIEFALKHEQPYILFNLTYPHMSTIEEIVAAFSKVAGFTTRRPSVPLFLLLLAALPFEILGKLGLKTRIHRDRVRKLVLSTKIYPGWLVKHGYRFKTDQLTALSLWRDETDGRFI